MPPTAGFVLPLHLHIVLLLAAKLFLNNYFRYIVLFFISASCNMAARAQYQVKGTVYDNSRIYPIPSVSVMSSSGRGTTTDSVGRYQIPVSEKDSIWFSFLGKATPKYAVTKIVNIAQFDVALELKTNVLEEVRIRSRSYKEDSVQNRRDYARIFNFQRPNIQSLTSVNATGAGININELIRVFQFKKNKATERFRERLLQQEKEKFIDHRFNKALIKRLTQLDGDSLNLYMQQYRPVYEFAVLATEYDFQLYIKESADAFKKNAAL